MMALWLLYCCLLALIVLLMYRATLIVAQIKLFKQQLSRSWSKAASVDSPLDVCDLAQSNGDTVLAESKDSVDSDCHHSSVTPPPSPLSPVDSFQPLGASAKPSQTNSLRARRCSLRAMEDLDPGSLLAASDYTLGSVLNDVADLPFANFGS